METRRRKLQFRASRRGFREMDLIMGQFANTHIDKLTAAELDEFERLLQLPDWDVYQWIIGEASAPADTQGPVLDRLREFRYDPRG